MSHPTEHVPRLDEWIGWWTFDPLVIAGLAAGVSLYMCGALRMPRPSPRRAAAYCAGILVAALALLSPLDGMSDVLFSAHMAQHELLMLIAAPLIVLGRPLEPALWALPRSARVRASHSMHPARVWRVLTHPVIAIALHAVTRVLWHVPALFDAALADEGVHALQHVTFFATAVVFWWSLIYGRYGRLGYGVGVAFVFVTMMYSGLIGAVISLADHSLYAHELPTQRWGIDPVEDQQRAGLLMWVPAAVIMMSLGLAIFAAWLGQSARLADRNSRHSSTRCGSMR